MGRRQNDFHPLALDADQSRDGDHAVGQGLVVGLVGNIVGDVIGGDDGNRPQDQQGRQHPVENFAEQGVRCEIAAEGPVLPRLPEQPLSRVMGF